MVWGAMSAHGTAGLYFLQPGTTTNGTKYLDLLMDKLRDPHGCAQLQCLHAQWSSMS